MTDHAGRTFTGPNAIRNDIYPSISATQTPSLHQKGKVVLVTGASRGIGRAIALQYAHADVAVLILVTRGAETLDAVEKDVKGINSGVKVIKVVGDMTKESDVEKVKAAVEKDTEGKLDVLINNAGVAEVWTLLPQSNPAEWWNTFEVNLKAPYLVLRALLPLLTATAKAHGPDGKVDVVNMTSIGAHIVMPTASAYQISKLAVLRLTEFVHVESGGDGVVAVGVHPGGVKTDMTKDIGALQPMLIDTPELAAGFCVWLTAENRKWLSGRYVAATWDVEKLESMKEEIVKGDKLKVKMVV